MILAVILHLGNVDFGKTEVHTILKNDIKFVTLCLISLFCLPLSGLFIYLNVFSIVCPKSA